MRVRVLPLIIRSEPAMHMTLKYNEILSLIVEIWHGQQNTNSLSLEV